MPLFIDEDIYSIKQKILSIAYLTYHGRFNFDKYIENGLICDEAVSSIIAYLNIEYSSLRTVKLDPLPMKLYPIIGIAKHMIAEERRKTISRKYSYEYDPF